MTNIPQNYPIKPSADPLKIQYRILKSLWGNLEDTEDKTFLCIPFFDKDQAKSIAKEKRITLRWDKNNESWYVPADQEHTSLAKWQKDQLLAQTPKIEHKLSRYENLNMIGVAFKNVALTIELLLPGLRLNIILTNLRTTRTISYDCVTEKDLQYALQLALYEKKDPEKKVLPYKHEDIVNLASVDWTFDLKEMMGGKQPFEKGLAVEVEVNYAQAKILQQHKDVSVKTVEVKNVSHSKIEYNQALFTETISGSPNPKLTVKAYRLYHFIKKLGHGSWTVDALELGLATGINRTPKDVITIKPHIAEINRNTIYSVMPFWVSKEKKWLFIIS